jgi:hypothetical protein
MWLWCGHKGKPSPNVGNPRSRISLFDPNFSSVSETTIVRTAGFVRLQVTTPHTLVPSHNNSSRGSNLRSTLYMWLSSWYGLIRLKFLSLQFIAKCPYLSYNQHSVSVFSSQYNCPTLAFVFRTDCSIFRNVEFNINHDTYQYVPWYHVSSGLTVYSSQWTNSATHSGSLQQLVTMNCDEPPSPFSCHPL